MEPTLSWNPESLWDVPVPSHPCPTLHPGVKSSHHLLCNIFSPGLVDTGQSQCGWGWLTLPPLWKLPENSSVQLLLGKYATLDCWRHEPKETHCFYPLLQKMCCPLCQGRGKLVLPFHRRVEEVALQSASGLGLTAVVILSLPLGSALLPWEPRPPPTGLW